MTAPSRVVCIGGAVRDRKLHLHAPAAFGTSNPASGTTSAGGVARNVTENLARLGIDVALVSRVGRDAAGTELTAGLAALGADVTAVTADAHAGTAEYLAVLDPAGELVLGVADMAVLERIGVADLDAVWPGTGWVFADCNLAPDVLAHLLARGRATGADGRVRVAVDAVSTPKVTRLPADLAGIGLLFCNRDEARALLARIGALAPAVDGLGPGDQGRACDGSGPGDEDEPLVAGLLAAGVAAVVLTRGPKGVLAAARSPEFSPPGPVAPEDPDITPAAATPPGFVLWQVPAVPAAVVDVTGAGDALVAGVLSGLARGRSLPESLVLGTLTAALTVECDRSVRPDLGPELVAAELENRSR
ncbi:MAG TPA: PfkB family carbohydrate kinase [Kineosporiaceae bacterium]|nr:PfkB family carbohydrate kinase [Kineosporiaceae bacterium]